MKVFLALGNEDIEDVIKECDFEIVDSDDNLLSLIDLIEYIDIDAIVVNRLLDDDGEVLLKLANKAVKKSIKLVVLIEDYEDYEERRLITNLVNLGITAFVKLGDITKEILEETLHDYPQEFDFSIFSKEEIIKEKYISPDDYRKIIGIYSPYSVGKTVLAANLAKCYEKNKLSVTLIDTDHNKKDILYYFPLENNDYLKMTKLYKDIQSGKEIEDISDYEINISKRLKIFTDHRDSVYKITGDMINTIVRNSDSNIVILDISRYLDNKLINEMLSLCDEKIIVADKMLSTLNGLPYKLNLNNYNKKNLNLVINKNVNLKSLSDKEIANHFRDIAVFGKEKHSLDFNDIFFIPDKFELIAEAIADREAAYGKDQEFDKCIEKIATSLYHMNTSKPNKKSFLGKLFKK